MQEPPPIKLFNVLVSLGRTNSFITVRDCDGFLGMVFEDIGGNLLNENFARVDGAVKVL